MVKSLYTGVSGMKTHQWRMDVIGNNISNVNTVGFKSDVPVFKDIAYMTKRTPSGATSTLGGINPSQVGYGVGMNSVTANMTQSGYTSSDNVWDMSIVGNGFFQVMDGAGNIYYTRAGNFKVDDDGYITNANGYHVLGTNGTTEGQAPGSEILRVVVPETNAHTSSATKRINNSNVTVTVSTPSDYTDMSVSFQDSAYPYATFSNNILTVFFNRDAQYSSQEEFSNAIQRALDAGGVNLPDDVQLSVSIEGIPNETDAVAAKNKVDGYDFKTTNATAEIHTAYNPKDGTIDTTTANNTAHAYINFSIPDPGNSDSVQILYGTDAGKKDTGEVEVNYDSSTKLWTVRIFDDTNRSNINDKIKEYLNDNPSVPKLSLNSFIVPTSADRATVFQSWADQTAPDATNNVPAGQKFQGVPAADSSKYSGMFDVEAKEKGEFGNNYKVVFSSVSGYGKTNATWDENTLNIQVCADTTIAEINSLIKDAARGDEKKILIFNDIAGLDYGGYKTEEFMTDPTIGPDTTATTGTFKVQTDFLGNKVYTEWDSANNQAVSGGTVRYINADGSDAGTTDPSVLSRADQSKVFSAGLREAYFGGNPSVGLKDGGDAFYTQIAKSLSTFNLTDGRVGEAQNLDTITDYMIQADGTILGKHAIHGTMVLGRIDLVTFDNPNGLQKVGGTNFAATVASGEAHVKVPTKDGAGEIVAGTLEMSNVDLADEFTNMITTQRGYQANSRVITVSDTMIEELLSLKR